jgi:hypothetical protein
MNLHYQAVSPVLVDCLQKLMSHPAFKDFYLVGGTSLAFQRGHRLSIDIDLFTCIPYGQMKTAEIETALQEMFPYTDRTEELHHSQMVYSMYVGDSKEDCIKLDLCYDDDLIFPLIEVDGLRMASEKEIAAMKIQAITQVEQRRKDFWDIHELLDSYTLSDMIGWGIQRYPWSVTKESVKDGIERLPLIKDFTEVVCLKGKYWEFIVEDLLDEAKSI